MTASIGIQDSVDVRQVLVKAALLGAFHPLELIGPDPDSAVLASLSDCSEEVSLGGTYLWTLVPEVRRAALAHLPPPGPERQKLLSKLPRRDEDQLATALLECLSPRPPTQLTALLATEGVSVPKSLTTGDAISLYQAIQLLTAAGVSLAEWAMKPEVLRSLQRAAALLQQMDAARTLIGPAFRGRKRELEALRYFGETGALQEGNQATPALARDLSGLIAVPRVPALVVTGIGGVGKSALMERLRQQLSGPSSLTVAVFDLDQVALRSGERVALTLDLLRMIALAQPRLAREIDALRKQMREAMSEAGGHHEAGGSAVLSAIAGLSPLPFAHDWRLLIVFDTFEEALVAGEERVRRISDWLSVLADTLGDGRLRVIFSGRAAELLKAMKGTRIDLLSELRLGDLGVRAGRARLRDLFKEAGIPHLDLVAPLVAAHGSNALVLEIIARYCVDRPHKDIQAFAGETLAEAAGMSGEGFGAEYRQRFLYRRILERLPDPALRRLACPGLVLRQITPRAIAEVLAAPCGLETPMPSERAEDLFDKLARQVWLVEPGSGPRELVHRNDLRRMMLPAILAEAEARAVATGAAAWYERWAATDPAAELDALYYRMLVDPESLPEDDGLLRRLAVHLGPAIAELPAAVQARIKVATGETLRLEQIVLLRGEARMKAVSTRRTRQVAEGLEATILTEATDLEPDLMKVSMVARTGATASAFESLVVAEDAGMPDSNSKTMGTLRDAPDLIRAQFADCDFASIADRNADLFAEFIRASDDDSPLTLEQDPAWLILLSALSTPDKRESRIQDFQSILIKQSIAARAPQISGTAVVASTNHSRLLLLAASLLGISTKPVFSSRWRDVQDFLSRLGNGVQVRTLEDWRLMFTYPLSHGLQAVLYPRAAGYLQVNLLEDMIAQANGVDPFNLTQGVRQLVDQLKNLNPPTISEVSRIASELAADPILFGASEVDARVHKPLLPGRVPELHAALRLILVNHGQVEHLSDVVAQATSGIPWWPHELSPDRFERLPNSTVVSALITMADDCGRLPNLVAALAEANPANFRLQRLADLSNVIVNWLWTAEIGAVTPTSWQA